MSEEKLHGWPLLTSWFCALVLPWAALALLLWWLL